MNIAEQHSKLAIIARQTSDELDGYAAEASNRGMFPGEQAAITWRRVELAKQVRT